MALTPAADPRAGVRPGIDVSFARLVSLREVATRRARFATPSIARPGGFTSRRRGSGNDVHDVRPFAEGDDLRSADAAATARTGKLHVRTYHADEDRAALLVADFRRPMLWGTQRRLRSVAAAEALAVIGWRVADAGGRVGLLAVRPDDTDFVPPRERERAMLRVAGALEASHRRALQDAGAAAAAGSATPPLATTLERAGRLVPRGAAIVVATGLDVPGDELAAVVGSLARRSRVHVILVLDALDVAPPTGILAYFGDDGTVSEGRFGTDMGDERAASLRAVGATVQTLRAVAEDAELATLSLEMVR